MTGDDHTAAATTIQTVSLNQHGSCGSDSGLNRKTITESNSEPSGLDINRFLAEHQRREKEWDQHRTAVFIQACTAVLTSRFNLGILKLAVCVEVFRFRDSVRFRFGMNGFGLRGELQVNTKHLSAKPPWLILARLLFALLQAWQQEHGDPGKKSGGKAYFNAEFRRKARECGLDVDEDGNLRLDPEGAFAGFMRECGVPFPDASEMQEPMAKPRGSSKLKRWACKCGPIRVGRPRFRARCLDCGEIFLPSEPQRASEETRPGERSEPAQGPNETVTIAALEQAEKNIGQLTHAMQNSRAKSRERIELPLIDNKSILTETGGFLEGGSTHTCNLALGCAFAKSICGKYCYAGTNRHITKGRPWGLYGYKRNIRGAYRQQYETLKRPKRGEAKPLRIFLSSSTDPYAPQEIALGSTRALLEEMLDRPPDALIIQTRSPLIGRDFDLICRLSSLFELWVSMTIETDMERIPGLPNHATPIRKRIAALKQFHDAGILTQAAVSPLLPLADPESFARDLNVVCTRVILDHFMIGDGSKNGLRTRKTGFPQLLEEAGFGEWNDLDKLWETKRVFDRVLGPGRVLVSSDGFNAIGPNRK